MIWLWALLPVMLGWAAGNVAGWWLTEPGPFNWRALTHSSLYYKWLDTRDESRVD